MKKKAKRFFQSGLFKDELNNGIGTKVLTDAIGLCRLLIGQIPTASHIGS
jgi:hypothetical protein